MASSSEAKPNNFAIEIHSSILRDTSKRKGCMKEIIPTISALLNSDGGSLTLRYDKTPLAEDISEIVRNIEQRVRQFLPVSKMIFLVKVDRRSPCKTLINIKGSDKLCIINCHIYLPSDSQVLHVQGSHATEEIVSIIHRKGYPNDPVIAGSHCQHFVQNEVVDLKESKTVQLKMLEANATKHITLADRIVKTNKLAPYVSAFANYLGGHIYYGIENNGIVKGERISEDDKHKIVDQVKKAVHKMICPAYDEGMKEKSYDIHFVPVVNSSGNPVSSTYVIVIYIAQCPPGSCMFTELPESYHIVEGKVEPMNFDACWTLLISGSLPSSSVPSGLPCIRWCSKRNMRIYRVLTTKLVEFRNDQEPRRFKELKDFALKKWNDSITGLVVLSEEAMAYLKHCDFRKARSTLKLFEKSLKNYDKEDAWILHVVHLYVKSRFERATGNYEESYKLAVDGLQMMDRFPAEFIAVRFYLQTATLATILASEKDDRKERDDLVSLENSCLDLASRNAEKLRAQDLEQRILSDLTQKVRIYKAEAHMGCSLTGEASPDCRHVTSKDLDNADDELTKVTSLNHKDHFPTRFRSVQLLLAQSDLHYRRLQLNVKDRPGSLAQATEYAEEALKLANKYNFKELVLYAEKRLKLFFAASPTVDVEEDVFLIGLLPLVLDK